MRLSLLVSLASVLALLGAVSFSRGASPTARHARRWSPPAKYVNDALASEAERQAVLADLVSGDADKVAVAVEEVRYYGSWPQNLNLFIQTGRYDDLEKAAIDKMLLNAGNNSAMAEFEKLRAEAFWATRKPDQALAATKAYFNLAPLKETANAIAAMRDGLQTIEPDGKRAAQFAAEQLDTSGGAVLGESATRPSDGVLSDGLLASIPIDGSPFAEAIHTIQLTDYRRNVEKGNLLLASDRCTEAQKLFEGAMRYAPPKELPQAIENVARAIRARTGKVGPANAYILAMRSQ